jgi:hypothetical protein
LRRACRRYPEAHVAELRQRLAWLGGLAREALARHPAAADEASTQTHDERETAHELRRLMPAADVRASERGVPTATITWGSRRNGGDRRAARKA